MFGLTNCKNIPVTTSTVGYSSKFVERLTGDRLNKKVKLDTECVTDDCNIASSDFLVAV